MSSPVSGLFFMKPKSILQAIFSGSLRKEDGTGCIEWQGSLGTHGYGQMNIMNRVYQVPRVAYAASKGHTLETYDELAGACILHRCDNRKCVNPDHLYKGDRLQNRKDAVERGRVKGGHLSREDLKRVKQALKTGESQRSIAARFGVGQPFISRINTGLRRQNG